MIAKIVKATPARATVWAHIDAVLQGQSLTLFAVGLMIGTGVYMTSGLPILPLVLGVSWVVIFAIVRGVVSPDLYHSFKGLTALGLGVWIGLLVSVIHAHNAAAPRIQDLTRPVYVEGWVSDIEYGNNGPRVRILVHAIEGLTKAQTPRYVRLTHISALEMAAGRFVRCWSVLRPPPRPSIPGDFDFRRKAWFEQLGGVGYVRGKCRGGVLEAPPNTLDAMRVKLAGIRFAFSRYVADRARPETAGLSAALVTGDRSGIDPQHVADLRTVGLSHLLAISGLHLGLVCGLAFGLFRSIFAVFPWLSNRVPSPYAGAAGALVCGTLYLLMSGGSVSTQRAFIMSSIFFGAMLMDRNALSLRGLSIALILVLLLQPQSIIGAGFQMSFAATGALILVYASWNKQRYEQGYAGRANWLRFFLMSVFVTSFVAGLATLPFAYYHFGRTAPMSLFANIIVMPIVSFVTAPSAALAAVLAPIDGGGLGLMLYSHSLYWVVEISGFFARHSRNIFGEGPFAPVNMPMASAVLFFAAMIIGLYRFERAYWVGSVVVACMAVVFWILTPKPVAYLARSGEVFWANADGAWVSTQVYEMDAMTPMSLKDFVVAVPSCDADTCNVSKMGGEDWPTPQALFERGSVVYGSQAGLRYKMGKCDRRPWDAC